MIGGKKRVLDISVCSLFEAKPQSRYRESIQVKVP